MKEINDQLTEDEKERAGQKVTPSAKEFDNQSLTNSLAVLQKGGN